MKRSPPPKRRTPMPRSGRVRPRNPERRDEKHARNFGEEAERVRVCERCIAGPSSRWYRGESFEIQGAMCSGTMVTAHVVARGMGGANGGRFDLVAMCQRHHDEQHLIGVESFAARYGLDLRAEADRIALEHPRPLGIRGLADRFAAEHRFGCARITYTSLEELAQLELMSSAGVLEYEGHGHWRARPLDTYETDALLGWVLARQQTARDVARVSWPDRRDEADQWDGRSDANHDALTKHIASVLGIDEGAVRALREAAGWPS